MAKWSPETVSTNFDTQLDRLGLHMNDMLVAVVKFTSDDQPPRVRTYSISANDLSQDMINTWAGLKCANLSRADDALSTIVIGKVTPVVKADPTPEDQAVLDAGKVLQDAIGAAQREALGPAVVQAFDDLQVAQAAKISAKAANVSDVASSASKVS